MAATAIATIAKAEMPRSWKRFEANDEKFFQEESRSKDSFG